MFGLCVAFMVVSFISQTQLDRLSQGRHVYHKAASGSDAADEAALSSKAAAGSS
jgi:hypothetical protein